MGTTADKLNKILTTKQAIKQAIVDKGVDVSDDTVFADYPSKIGEISTGSYYEALWNAITNNDTDYYYLFSYSNATEIDTSNFDTSNVTDMRNMFYNCKNLTSLDVSNFDTSKVTNMYYMFYSCESLTSLDVSNFDTSNVTSMSNMFYGCESLTSLDVSNFDTSNVTTMDGMFIRCESLTTLDVSNFDTSKVTAINSMFSNCYKLISLDCSNWDISKVTGTYNLGGAFNYCNKLVDFKAPKNISAPMDVSGSPLLSHDSLMSIINNLITTTSTKTLTLGTDNLAKLTEEEKAIATGKGWTLK